MEIDAVLANSPAKPNSSSAISSSPAQTNGVVLDPTLLAFNSQISQDQRRELVKRKRQLLEEEAKRIKSELEECDKVLREMNYQDSAKTESVGASSPSASSQQAPSPALAAAAVAVVRE